MFRMRNKNEVDRRRKWWMWFQEGRGNAQNCQLNIRTQPVGNGAEEEAQLTKEGVQLSNITPMSVNIIFRKTEHYRNRHGPRRLH